MTGPDLSRIRDLTDGELRGWWETVIIARIRPKAPGERAMLIERARQLGLEVKS